MKIQHIILIFILAAGMVCAADNSPISLKICKDRACTRESIVFLQNEDIYIDYETQDKTYSVMAVLTYPDSHTKQLMLPAKANATLTGPYVIEATATGPGSVKLTKRFGVIEAPVQKAAKEPVHAQESLEQTEELSSDRHETEKGSASGINDLMVMQDKSSENTSSSKKWILTIVYLLLGLLALITALYLVIRMKNKGMAAAVQKKSLKQLAEEHDMHRPHKFMNKMVTYIDSSLKHGYSTKSIYEHMYSLGWKEKQINEGFRRYELLGNYHDMKSSKMSDKDIKKALSKDYNQKQIKETLSHHSAILGKDATQKDKMRHLSDLAKTHNVHKVDNKLSRLQTYIKKCYGHGYSHEMIRSTLINKGWPVAIVDRAFDLLR